MLIVFNYPPFERFPSQPNPNHNMNNKYSIVLRHIYAYFGVQPFTTIRPHSENKPSPYPSSENHSNHVSRPSIACKVLSLYNMFTLTTNNKAGYAVVKATTQPYPTAEGAAKGMTEFYQTFANQRRSFLLLVREVIYGRQVARA